MNGLCYIYHTRKHISHSYGNISRLSCEFSFRIPVNRSMKSRTSYIMSFKLSPFSYFLAFVPDGLYKKENIKSEICSICKILLL